MRVESTDVSYLASQGNDVAQHDGQGANHGPNLRVDAPSFLLHDVIKGEEHRSWVPPVNPLDLGSSPRVWVIALPDQGPGWLCIDSKWR
jgi:hypothetical protein